MERVRSARAYILLGVAALALAFPPFFVTGFIAAFVIIAMLYVALATAWNLLLGYVGELSFGSVAFFGVGAYTVGLLHYYKMGVSPPFDILVGAGVAALVALILGYPLLRVRGIYFAIGTLGLSEIIRIVVRNSGWTRGSEGVYVPSVEPYSVFPYYFGALALGLLTVLVTYRMVNSRVGLAFMCIRDNPEAARMVGLNITAYKMLGFVIHALFFGLAGGFFAHYNTYVSTYEAFSLILGFKVIVMVIFGGTGTMLGPLIGALAVFALEEVGRTYITLGYPLLLAGLLVVSVLFLPAGIVGTRIGRKRVARRGILGIALRGRGAVDKG